MGRRSIGSSVWSPDDRSPRLPDALAAADFPEAFVLVVEGQQAIARIVTLAAVGAGNEAADVHSAAVVIFGNGKTGAATARDEEHAETLLGAYLFFGAADFHRSHPSVVPALTFSR